jgi:hypothetical protein
VCYDKKVVRMLLMDSCEVQKTYRKLDLIRHMPSFKSFPNKFLCLGICNKDCCSTYQAYKLCNVLLQYKLSVLQSHIHMSCLAPKQQKYEVSDFGELRIGREVKYGNVELYLKKYPHCTRFNIVGVHHMIHHKSDSG